MFFSPEDIIYIFSFYVVSVLITLLQLELRCESRLGFFCIVTDVICVLSVAILRQ